MHTSSVELGFVVDSVGFAKVFVAVEIAAVVVVAVAAAAVGFAVAGYLVYFGWQLRERTLAMEVELEVAPQVDLRAVDCLHFEHEKTMSIQ